MAAGISITIGANDVASGVIAKVKTGLESLNRRALAARAPMDRMAASLGRFGQITGVDRLASDMGGLGRQIGATAAGLGRFAPALGAITGAASVAGLASLVERWTAFGSRLGFDAQRIGVTASSLQGLQGAAQLAGSSAEALTGGLTTLQDGLMNAAAGRAPQMVGLLSQLGISFLDAGGHARKAADVMPLLADKIASIRDPSQRAMVATMAFGSAGESLLPFLTRGAAGIREYNAAAESYGVFNRRGVDAAQALREEQTRLSLALDGVGNSVSESVAPVLVPMLRQLSDWVRDNRGGIAEFFHTIAQAMKDWVDGGGITLLIDRLKAVYDTLARIVGIADSVGHGLRSIWDTTAALPQVDEFGRPVQPAGPATGLPAPSAIAPTVPGQDNRPGWIERNMPTWLGGRDASGPAPGTYGYSTPRERIGAHIALGHATPALPPAEQERRGLAAIDQLVALGRSPQQAAGIVAGLGRESGFKTEAIGDGGAARGLPQWHPDRQALAERYIGKPVSEMTQVEQIRAIDHELRTNEARAGAALTRTRTSAEAGDAVSRFYERPADVEGEASARARLAMDWESKWRQSHPEAALPTPLVPPAPSIATVPATAPPGAQGQPGPDGKATVRLTFDNPPPNMRTSTVAQGGLRVEMPTLGAVP